MAHQYKMQEWFWLVQQVDAASAATAHGSMIVYFDGVHLLELLRSKFGCFGIENTFLKQTLTFHF